MEVHIAAIREHENQLMLLQTRIRALEGAVMEQTRVFQQMSGDVADISRFIKATLAPTRNGAPTTPTQARVVAPVVASSLGTPGPVIPPSVPVSEQTSATNIDTPANTASQASKAPSSAFDNMVPSDLAMTVRKLSEFKTASEAYLHYKNRSLKILLPGTSLKQDRNKVYNIIRLFDGMATEEELKVLGPTESDQPVEEEGRVIRLVAQLEVWLKAFLWHEVQTAEPGAIWLKDTLTKPKRHLSISSLDNLLKGDKLGTPTQFFTNMARFHVWRKAHEEKVLEEEGETLGSPNAMDAFRGGAQSPRAGDKRPRSADDAYM